MVNIILKIKDHKDISIPLEEAERLYKDLKVLFGDNVPVNPIPPYNPWQTPLVPISPYKLGDTWQWGDHTITCDVDKLFSDDLIIRDAMKGCAAVNIS